ncbi:hypothetical protein QQX98_002332 [Neonectria punicea]|uniref:NADH:flavin oxidoreductase/NADH oxidase N-terminal domain-containing protein n=1 Tax=Neonectria punicea TaxID=979145 RepID=A0ABR1HK67_9HYPO
MDSLIAQPLTLKSGLVLPNRLVKASMAENLADKDLLPTELAYDAYKAWADGGWGLVLTGNVQVDARFLGQAHDITNNDAIGRSRILDSWKEWATIAKKNGTPIIVQISHPGRQSPAGAGTRGFFARSVAPSAVPLRLGRGVIPGILSRLLFGTPREMTALEIKDVIQRFVDTAVLVAEAGFDGIELHSAHGYLLAQFLAEATNKRTDEYGGSPAARAKIVVEVIEAIRAAVPAGFSVGIKFNSVDHQSPSALKDCIEQLQLIVNAGIDFLEVSGGTYEDPQLHRGPDNTTQNTKSDRSKAREAFFLDFAKAIRGEFPELPLLVTGGFRSREVMANALSSDSLDLIGIARPAVLNPLLPKNTILNPEIKDQNARAYARSIEPSWLFKLIGNVVIGAGVETAWYGSMIAKIPAWQDIKQT